MADQAGSADGVPRNWETFLNVSPAQVDPNNARVMLIPVPYDSTTSYRGGARDGPRAIIAASRQLEDYDLELDRDISEVGIYTAPEIEPDVSGPEAMVERVRRVVKSVADKDKLVGLLGGEHTITTGAVKALTSLYPDLSVLYMDAHADLREEYMGTGWGHASVARRLHDICPLIEVGVRSLSSEELRFISDAEIPVVFWHSETMDMSKLATQVLESLSDHVYVSVDLDVFDPSTMAAVGTPEPGGMTWPEVTGLLRTIAEQRSIVGFDLAELTPSEGPEACAFTAAKLAYKLIGYATQRVPGSKVPVRDTQSP
jgi:agmatinase